MNLNKTLVAYEDGSEYKVNDFAVSIGLALAATALIVGTKEFISTKYWNRKQKKWNEQNKNTTN